MLLTPPSLLEPERLQRVVIKKISLVFGMHPSGVLREGAPPKAWAVGVNCRANYTTAIAMLLHNFRMTNFIDKRGDKQDSQTPVLLYNELEE